MGSIDPNCTELVLLIRYKELSKTDQKRIANLINLLSGHIRIAKPDEPYPPDLTH